MSAMSFQELVKIGDNKAIVLCFSATDSGDKFFHYIKADRVNIKKMHYDYLERKEVDFSEYGEILYSGWGERPSEAEELMMREKYYK